jgi:hypothetical protein
MIDCGSGRAKLSWLETIGPLRYSYYNNSAYFDLHEM